MANQPLVLTDSDVRDPNLLLRYLRKASAQITDLMDRLSRVESAPTPLSAAQLQASVQATGSNPINVTGLLGVLAQPQPASATVYTVAPSGQVLQSLRDQQLVAVGTQSTGYALNLVIGGNPNSLYQLIAGLTTSTVTSTSTNLMTLDTAQTSTGAKSLTLAAGAVATPSLTFSTSTSNGVYTTSSGSFSLGVLGAQVANFSTVGVAITKILSSYNGDTLAGNGVGSIVSRIGSTGINGNIGTVGVTTNLYQPLTSGEYEVGFYVVCVTAGSANVNASYRYNDGVTTVSASPLIPLGLSLAGVMQNIVVYLHATTSTNIQFMVFTTSTLNTGTFNYYATLKRLS